MNALEEIGTTTNTFLTSARMALPSALEKAGVKIKHKCIQDAHDVFSVFPSSRVVLIGHGKETLSENEKEMCESQARKWIARNKRGVVMVYSPQCKHCHDAMPLIATEASHSDMPVLLINAMAMPRSALFGPKAIHNIEYYPTFLVKKPSNGTLERVRSVAEAFTVESKVRTDKDNTKQNFIESLF